MVKVENSPELMHDLRDVLRILILLQKVLARSFVDCVRLCTANAAPQIQTDRKPRIFEQLILRLASQGRLVTILVKTCGTLASPPISGCSLPRNQFSGSYMIPTVQLLGKMTIATILEAEIGICICGLSHRYIMSLARKAFTPSLGLA
jgi:hypothetical protein